MMLARQIRRFLIGGVTVLVTCGNAMAHNEWGLGHPSLIGEAAVDPQLIDQVSRRQTQPGARYVFERLLLWTPGSILTGCFYDGSADERQRTVRATQSIFEGKGINLSIDFGQAPDYRTCTPPGSRPRAEDIRVSFQNGCCAAYIGRTAHRPKVVRQGPTVFLEGHPSPGTIKHEILHAVGFHHEHQSPAAPCEAEFNIDQMAESWGWTRKKTLDNVAQLQRNSRKYKWGAFYDNDSIMKYYFEVSFLRTGTSSPCYSSINEELSSEDYAGLREAYPMDKTQSDVQSAVRAGISLINQNALPENIRELINLNSE